MASPKMQLPDWLDDLCVRFLINLPQEELEDTARICFQVEEAQWYYEDFIRDLDPTLPSLNLKQFSLKILRHCPLTSAFTEEQHLQAYEEFLGYKTQVPVRGAILLNEAMDKVLLVKGWKSNASWSFPRGKINKDEPDLDCAIREVYEETGFDIRAAGLAPVPEAVKAIDVTMRQQHMRLFVIRGVPEDTVFEPQTRKEISKIDWYRLDDLPTLKKPGQAAKSLTQAAQSAPKFYVVAPFLGPLRKWINQQHKIEAQEEREEYLVPDEVPSEVYAPVQEAPPAAGDPALELKKLLSVQPPSSIVSLLPSIAPIAPQEPINPLLAILRGGPSHPAVEQSAGRTGLYPNEAHSDLAAFSQPPPAQQVHSMSDPREQMLSRFSAGQTPQQPGQFQPSAQHIQLPMFQSRDTNRLLSHSQQSLLQAFHQAGSAQPAAPVPPADNPPVQPTAPAASNLPFPPQLNEQRLGLLAMLKNGGSGAPAPSSGLASAVRQNPPPEIPQTSSLLDLFKAKADPVVPTGPASQMKTADLPPQLQREQAISGISDTSKPAATRKASAMSMITRQLPRVKLQEPSVPAPLMDNENFPTLGAMTVTVKKKAVGNEPFEGMLPQEDARRAGPPPPPMKILSRPSSAKISASTSARPDSRPPSRGKPAGPQDIQPMKILKPPGTARHGSIESRRTAAPSEHVSSAKPAFQPMILKRGEAIGAVADEKPAANAVLPTPPPTEPKQASGAGPSQRDALLGLFAQSSAVRKPSLPLASPPLSPLGHESLAASFASLNDIARPASSALSTDSLPDYPASRLDLSRHASQSSGFGGGGAGPGVIGDRGRVPSAAELAPVPRHGSVVRQGSVGGSLLAGEGQGPLSPGTPVEAKGFLMDYLNGVVRGGK